MKRALALVILCAAVCGAWGQRATAQAPAEGAKENSANVLSVETQLATLGQAARAKLDPALVKQFAGASASAEGRRQAAPQVTFLVTMAERAPLGGVSTHQQLAARRVALVNTLQATANRSQAGVVSYLQAEQARKRVSRYTSYWAFNGLAVEGDLGVALALAQRPDVASLRANRVHHLEPRPANATLASDRLVEWNLTRIHADQVWDGLGVTGRGVVVANMDSGVDWTHPALRGAYRGYNAADPGASTHDYNWYDPTGTYLTAPGPNQAHISAWSDHGTHTMGTIVGSDPATGRITGVAPGARWVAVKVFNDNGEATDEWIHAGFQWCLAPTNLAGGNPNPALAPDIVSNSWGDDNGYDLTFQRDFEAWQAAGIFSAWAAGNAGPNAGTVNSPASLSAALAVGATQSNDQIASFSSRGPSPWGAIKPDVVAPGADIYSTIPGGGYEGGWNGTSMATPHVAGLAALLLEASAHTLTITATQYAVTSTAVELGTPGQDNTFGHGRIDAYQAVSTAASGGIFMGVVRDRDSANPVDGATILMHHRTTGGQAQTTSDATGAYSFRVAEGPYDVTAEKFGYQSETATAVEIRAGMTTRLDFGLTRLPSGIVRGTVRSDVTGGPVSATIVISDGLVSLPVSAQGAYEIALPDGSYPLAVFPGGAGLRGEERRVDVVANSTQTLDFELASAPRLLVVDADAWSVAGVGELYRRDLHALLLGHDLFQVQSSTSGAPSAGLLAGYDVVIWAQALSSPGYIGAWGALGDYMDGGGALLISGQDIGYWDAAEGEGMAGDAYRDRLHATYLGDDAGLGVITGLGDGPLAGLTLTPNGAGSLNNQTAPDVIIPADALAQPVARYANGEVAAIAFDGCPTPGLYLAFGLEGISPPLVRQQVLESALVWLAYAPQPRLRVQADPSGQVAALGQTAQFDVELANSSSESQSLALEVSGSPYPARVVDAQTMQPISNTGLLAPCQSSDVRVLVDMPASAGLFEVANTRLRITGSLPPSAPEELTLRTEAAAPWRQGPGLPQPFYRANSVGQGCALYLFGGYDAYDSVNPYVYRFDLATNNWAAMAAKPTPAANMAVVLVGDVAYAIGGYDPVQQTPLATVEAYDLATDTWSARHPLPETLSGAVAVALDGHIYVFGEGLDGICGYVYDTNTDGWATFPAPPLAQLSFGQAVAVDGRIYLMGGWPSSRSLLRFSSGVGAWEFRQPMLTGRHSFAAQADGRYIYVAGGGQEWEGLSAAERYDTHTDTWVPMPDLGVADRAGATSAMASGRFYVLGGVGQGDESTPSMEILDIAPSLGGSTLIADRTYAQPGQLISMTVALRNPTAGAAAVGWRYPLPGGLSVEEAALPGDVVYDGAERVLRWSGSLPAGQGRAHNLSVRVNQDTPVGTTITSTLALEGQDCQPQTLRVLTRIAVPSLAGSTLTVDQEAARPGDVLRYTISVQNASPFPIGQALVRNPLPELTAYVVGSVSGASYDAGLNRIEWSGSLDAARASTPTFDWGDATAGQLLDLADDACVGPLPLGFTFQFYGKPYSSIYVNSNGMVLFEECSSQYGNTAIPSPEAPNAFVAPLWDDLRPEGSGRVYFTVTGTAPQRRAVIAWQAVNIYGQEAPQTFEVLLYEGSNQVILQYLTMTGERGRGTGATVGIEDATGTQGVQYLHDGVPTGHQLRNGLVLDLPHTSTITATRHLISYQVQVANPVPPLAVVRNTAWIDDGLQLYAPSITTTLATPQFDQSTKEISPERALSGGTVQVTVRLKNSGDLNATNVRLVDPVPEPLTLEPGSLSGTGARYDAPLRQVVWEGAVAVDHSAPVISYRARLAASLPASTHLSLPAAVSCQGQSMATLAAELMVNEIDLGTSSIMASASSAQAGDRITYTLTLVNAGNYAAEELRLDNPLPSELEMLVGTLAGGASYDAPSRTIRWSGPLAPQAEQVVSYAVTLKPSALDGALVSNTMRLEAGPNVSLERSALVTVRRGNLATSTMTVQPGWARPGDTVTYTMRLTNEGALPIGAGLVAAPVAPFTLLPGSIFASAGTVQLEGTPARLIWSGTLGSAEMVIVRYRARVSPEATPGIYTNGATLTDDGGLTYELRVPLSVGTSHVCLPLVFRQ